MKSLILSAILLLGLAAPATAGICTAQIQRVCKPNNPCRPSETLTHLNNSAEECLAHAKKLCTIYFSDGIASKQVRASFEGKPLSGGQNLCP